MTFLLVNLDMKLASFSQVCCVAFGAFDLSRTQDSFCFVSCSYPGIAIVL